MPPKKAEDFIGMDDADFSNDDQSETESEIAPIGLDGVYSDDGQGLYEDDDEDEEEEDEEVEDEEEGDEEEIQDEDVEEADDDEEYGSEEDESFSDGDPNELAQEGDEDDEDDDEEEEPVAKKPKGLGSLSRKLAALEEEIASIEKKQIEGKHWTLTGEVVAKARPLNSILESNIELPFGHMSMKRLDDSRELIVDENDFDVENPDKPKFDIELIIRQRVADRTFDDIVKKAAVTETVTKLKDSTEGLNFEKSTLGLAEVYAQQYEEDIFKQSASTEKLSAEKEAAKAVFTKLMHKLDCLTNFNFAPRPPVIRKPGTEGIKDLPAMKLEEPIPLIISSSVRANI